MLVQGHAYKTFPEMAHVDGYWGHRSYILAMSGRLLPALLAVQGWAMAEQQCCDIPLCQGRCAWWSECHSWVTSLLFSFPSACSA